GGQVDSGDPVDHAMVEFGDQGEPVAVDSFDDPDLPEWLSPVELGRDNPSRQVFELLVGSGSGEGEMADVILEVEAVVVYPDRTTVVGDPFETLAVAGDVLEFRFDVSTDFLDVDASFAGFERGRFEEDDGGDMHVRGPALQCQ